MDNLFGTDGVRGIYGDDLTDELAKELGYYGTKVLTNSHKPMIVIGTDTRESAHPLETALAEGISLAGGKVLLAGVVPTPAVAVLVRELGADAGIVVSASHNPYMDNGIKFFNKDGFKLPDSVEMEITRLIRANEVDMGVVPELNVERVEGAKDIYLDFLMSEPHERLDGVKIVLDCSNGANSEIAPEYFRGLGADLTVIADQPNGRNINERCGSTHLEALRAKVLETGADFGLAFDGDADRCLAVDNEGEMMDGDTIMSLMALKMKKEGCLAGDTIVITVMSNLGLRESLRNSGIDYEVTTVGDRYVLERMLEKGYTLGGEQSGHIIRLDRNTTGDGLLTASLLADIFAESKETAHELNSRITPYPQVLLNASVDNAKKYDYEVDPIIADKIHEVEDFFDGKGRVLVRASGTEPLVRVMIEALGRFEEIFAMAQETVALIESRLE